MRHNPITLQQVFAYWTECQLATVEYIELQKRYPKGEAKRQKSIADGMVDDCLRYGVTREDADFMKAGRLIEAMNEQGRWSD